MTLRVACSALGKRIYAGHPTKDGTRFREPRHDVTSDVLKAVIDKIKIGNEVEVSDGESIVARIAVLPPVTTPAADADRVRSVACLTRYSPLSTGNNKAMMQEDEAGLYVLRKQALAALKAEGK